MSYLEAHQNEAVVVITVDPARLSPDVGSQARLRGSIEALGATIEHPEHSSNPLATDNLRNLMLDIYAGIKRESLRRRRETAKK